MIHLQVVRFQNFMSYGNRMTEIRLDDYKTTLLVGINAAGKSSVYESLCFGLFRKPYRNINIPNLVNNVNQKDCLVEVEFQADGRQYLVRRGIKPAIFEIYVNGELIPQPASVYDYQDNLEKNILRMNFKTFCQIVILGTANFTPFMLLTPQVRREIVENLLDIGVFSKMNVILKQDQKRIDELLTKIEQSEKLIQSKISLMEKHIDERKKDTTSHINDLETQTMKRRETLAQLELDEAAVDAEIAAIEQGNKFDRAKIQDALSRLKQAQKQCENRQAKLLEAQKKISSLDVCPTCEQQVTDVARQAILTQKHELAKKLEDTAETIAGKIQTATIELEAALEIASKLADKHKERVAICNSQRQTKEAIETLENTKRRVLEKSKESIDTSELDKHRVAMEKLAVKKAETLEERELLSNVGLVLKDDGIKSAIIKQYVPVINELINSYLEQMGSPMVFVIDETFSETIKSAYKDDRSYESLSQGERMRVDLAILFTWREISKMRNAAHTNLLILDEVMDSSLDSEGTEDFLKIIRDASKETNIIIISHKAEQIIEKFDRVITFKKTNNFSEMVNVE